MAKTIPKDNQPMSIEDAINIARQPLPAIKSYPAFKGNSHAKGGGAMTHPLNLDDRIANDRGGGQ